ncbi:DAR GTPase 2, mitochondrial-like [Curcuma longa]|uniref:DAR GTPase 2, mitochondrial-like n=1 Tax=Curcuma longa TaxID=136217 RepID=UPI003D9DF25D
MQRSGQTVIVIRTVSTILTFGISSATVLALRNFFSQGLLPSQLHDARHGADIIHKHLTPSLRPYDISFHFQQFETWSLQFGSHPNLYVLDTPGILRPEIAHYHSGAKLALTGAIKDNLLDEHELARYFLAILNLSEEYKRWATPKDTTDSMPGSLEKHRRKGQYASDFTQDFIVKDVRQTLFDCISSFEGGLENECDMERLIESQIKALQEPLKVSLESSAHRHSTVATKLLKLYRTGRLGHYTLDLVDSSVQ